MPVSLRMLEAYDALMAAVVVVVGAHVQGVGRSCCHTPPRPVPLAPLEAVVVLLGLEPHSDCCMR